MISGKKCLPESELVAGKFGNPTLVTMYNVHYARMKLIKFFQQILPRSFYCKENTK